MKHLSFYTLTITLILLFNAGYILASADKIVAIVGNKKIMESEINTYTEKIPKPFKNAFKAKALENLINIQTFMQLAVEEGFDKDTEFISALNKTKNKMLADFYIKKAISSKINITEDEIKEYYHQHISEYAGKSKIHVAHISTPSMEDATKIKELLENGMSFDELMIDKSGNYGNFAGGDLGWLERGRMPADFEKTAFSLKKGEISKVVKTDIGFHIIKALDKKEGSTKTLTDVRSQIKEKLFQKKLNHLKSIQKEKIFIEIIK